MAGLGNQFGKQLDKLRQQRSLFLALIGFFAVIILWTVVSLFTSQKKVAISAELRTLGKPLTPTIEVSIFDRLGQKRSFSKDELANFSIYKIISTKDGSISRLVELGVAEDSLGLDANGKPTVNLKPTPTPIPSEQLFPSAQLPGNPDIVNQPPAGNPFDI